MKLLLLKWESDAERTVNTRSNPRFSFLPRTDVNLRPEMMTVPSDKRAARYYDCTTVEMLVRRCPPQPFLAEMLND